MSRAGHWSRLCRSCLCKLSTAPVVNILREMASMCITLIHKYQVRDFLAITRRGKFHIGASKSYCSFSERVSCAKNSQYTNRQVILCLYILIIPLRLYRSGYSGRSKMPADRSVLYGCLIICHGYGTQIAGHQVIRKPGFHFLCAVAISCWSLVGMATNQLQHNPVRMWRQWRHKLQEQWKQ